MLSKEEQTSLDLIEQAINSSTSTSYSATPVKRLNLEGFSNLWVKDESVQETGTHKDRMAWELVLFYKDLIKDRAKKRLGKEVLPQFSLISSGSAALALQTQFNKYLLPKLKILVDVNTSKRLLNKLKKTGCQIYTTSLSSKSLNSEDILRLTENIDGFDLTPGELLNSNTRFYDRLSCEILNENPDYVIVPYGTGQLYENILNFVKNIIDGRIDESLFLGDKEVLKKCNFIGITTNYSETVATKLYAPFRPFTKITKKHINSLIKKGYIGNLSRIEQLEESFIILGNSLLNRAGINSEYSSSVGLGFLIKAKDIDKKSKILLVNTGKAKI